MSRVLREIRILTGYSDVHTLRVAAAFGDDGPMILTACIETHADGSTTLRDQWQFEPDAAAGLCVGLNDAVRVAVRAIHDGRVDQAAGQYVLFETPTPIGDEGTLWVRASVIDGSVKIGAALVGEAGADVVFELPWSRALEARRAIDQCLGYVMEIANALEDDGADEPASNYLH